MALTRNEKIAAAAWASGIGMEVIGASMQANAISNDAKAVGSALQQIGAVATTASTVFLTYRLVKRLVGNADDRQTEGWLVADGFANEADSIAFAQATGIVAGQCATGAISYSEAAATLDALAEAMGATITWTAEPPR